MITQNATPRLHSEMPKVTKDMHCLEGPRCAGTTTMGHWSKRNDHGKMNYGTRKGRVRTSTTFSRERHGVSPGTRMKHSSGLALIRPHPARGGKKEFRLGIGGGFQIGRADFACPPASSSAVQPSRWHPCTTTG